MAVNFNQVNIILVFSFLWLLIPHEIFNSHLLERVRRLVRRGKQVELLRKLDHG